MKPPIFVFNYYDEFGLSIFESIKDAEAGIDRDLVQKNHYKILDYGNNPFVARIADGDSERIEIVEDDKCLKVPDELLGRLYCYLHVIYESLNRELEYRDKSLDETIKLVREFQGIK